VRHGSQKRRLNDCAVYHDAPVCGWLMVLVED
jgi:hypothetical protein